MRFINTQSACAAKGVRSTRWRRCQKTTVVPLNEELALVAADLSLETKLPMADAIILATARLYGAEVITSDADFDGIPAGAAKRRQRAIGNRSDDPSLADHLHFLPRIQAVALANFLCIT